MGATPLPLKKTVPICILLLCEAINGNSIFAYVGYMVLQLQHTDNKEDVGYYAGLIAGCWFFAQFLSSFFWGRMSDLFGRRPIMIVGVFGSFLSTIAFGFSFSLPWAIFARSLNGLLNGNIGVVKTYIAEFTDSSNQARAFGLLGLTWGIGNIIGSVVGGYTSNVAEKHPDIFSTTGLFGKFPFLLPNLIVAALSFVGFIVTIIFLQENEIKYAPLNDEIELSEGEGSPTLSLKESEASIEKKEDQVALLEESQIDLEEPLPEKLNFFQRQLKIFKELKKKNEKRGLKKGKGIIVLKDRYVLMTCFMYAILGLYGTIYDEVMPLWAMADKSAGGLGFGTDNIGTLNAVAGIGVIIMQLFIYHRIVGFLGAIKTFRFGSFLAIPLMCIFPAISYLNPVGAWSVWVGLITIILLRCLAMQCNFSSVMQLITNSADFADMGTVNGLGQSLVALFRALGPALGAPVLAWSFNNGHGFPLNHFFIFIVSSVLALVPLVLALRLPASLNKPMNEARASSSASSAESAEINIEFM